MNKITGIWLDNERAVVIDFDGSKESIYEIKSNIESGTCKGGSGMTVPYGPQGGVSESKKMERRKHQFQQYYDRIIEAIKNSESIYLFGPAEAKVGLNKCIKNNPQLSHKLQAVETADSMTLNQMIAQVKIFYKENIAE